MKPVNFGNRRGRFVASTGPYPPCPQSPPPPPPSPPGSPPAGSSYRTEFIPLRPSPSGLRSRPPDGQPSSDRPACPPDRQQPSSSRQPDDPRNTDQNPPAADAPRLSEKGKEPTKELAGKGVQEQHPYFVQAPQPELRQRPPFLQTSQPGQQQQPPILQNPEPQQQQQFSPLPSFVQHPPIFQTLQHQQQQHQQFSPLPSLVQQLSPFDPLIFQSNRPMAFSFSTPQLQQQLPSLFQTPQPQQQQQPSIFQTPQPQPQQQQQPLIFQGPQPQQQQQLQFSPFPLFGQQQQQQQQAAPPPPPPPPPPQWMLFTEDGSATSYNTRKRILEYRAESERLDQGIQLYDSSVSRDSLERDFRRILQELGGITTAIERVRVSVQDLMKKVNDMMWHREFATHSYMMLRPRFLHPNVPAASGTGSASHTVGAAGTSGQTNQLMTNSMAPIFEFYGGIPIGPSQYVHHIAAIFEKYITECCQCIEELEQLVLMDADKTSSNSLEALPRVMPNIYDYINHVAAKVENLHRYVESMKMAYLADQQRLGDGNDPCLSGPTSASCSSLFSAPTASAQSSSLFGLAGFTPQSTPFGTAHTSLFGSTQVPSGFGVNTASFSSTSVVGSSPLFATPSFGTDATAGSGEIFGAASKSSRPKYSSTRR